MAPLKPDIDQAQKNVQDVIQSIFQLMIQVSTYDQIGGRSSRDVLASEVTKLSQSLQSVSTSALSLATLSRDGVGPCLPAPLVEYVEHGRNPDIYTREFVELVRRMNQLMRGKMRAFSSFRDVLAHELAIANPELAEDVERVVQATGGPMRRDEFAEGRGEMQQQQQQQQQQQMNGNGGQMNGQREQSQNAGEGEQ